jgi:hypothetical protein
MIEVTESYLLFLALINGIRVFTKTEIETMNNRSKEDNVGLSDVKYFTTESPNPKDDKRIII